MSQKIIGPDMRALYSYQNLPIGATIIGTGAATVPTGTWRFYRPKLREAIPPCRSACPAGVDVRGFISLLKKKKYAEAYRSYVMENPFPGICGRGCDHPCEGECFRGDCDEALAIQHLELFLSTHGYSPTRTAISVTAPKSVVVVGSRLEELTCVYFLTKLGHSVSLFVGKEGLQAVYEKLVTAYGLSNEETWKREIERVIEPDSSVKMERDLAPENMNQFDLVIWGLNEQPISTPPDPFLLLKHEHTVAGAVGRGKETAIAGDLLLKKKDPQTGNAALVLGPHGFPSFERYLAFVAGEKPTESELVILDEINLESFRRQFRTGGKEISDIVKEAKRCFECGSCTLCGECVAYCPDQAVRPEQGEKRVKFDYAYCKGCGICAHECPRGAICFVKEESGWR